MERHLNIKEKLTLKKSISIFLGDTPFPHINKIITTITVSRKINQNVY